MSPRYQSSSQCWQIQGWAEVWQSSCLSCSAPHPSSTLSICCSPAMCWHLWLAISLVIKIESPGRLWLSVMTTILIGSPEEWRRRERRKSSTCSWWVTLRWNLSSAPGITLRYFCPAWCWAASAQEWSQSWWTSLGQVAWTPAGNLSEAAGSTLSPAREKISSLIMTVSYLPMNSL